MQTKEVDLGDGWKAVIRRPLLRIWMQWREATTVKEESEPAPLVREKGKDPEPPKEIKTKVGAEAYAVLESEMLPFCTLSITDPNGKAWTLAKDTDLAKMKPTELYLPDAGPAVIDALASEVVLFMSEAGGSPFRRSEDSKPKGK